jgi:hypothetical protein
LHNFSIPINICYKVLMHGSAGLDELEPSQERVD